MILTLIIPRSLRHGLEDLDDMQRQQEAIVEQLTIHVVRQNQWLAKAPVMPPMDKSITFIGPGGDEFSLPYQFCDSPDVTMIFYSGIYILSRFIRLTYLVVIVVA